MEFSAHLSACQNLCGQDGKQKINLEWPYICIEQATMELTLAISMPINTRYSHRHTTKTNISILVTPLHADLIHNLFILKNLSDVI